jgi:hypothetical protein
VFRQPGQNQIILNNPLTLLGMSVNNTANDDFLEAFSFRRQ